MHKICWVKRVGKGGWRIGRNVLIEIYNFALHNSCSSRACTIRKSTLKQVREAKHLNNVIAVLEVIVTVETSTIWLVKLLCQTVRLIIPTRHKQLLQVIDD